MLKIVHIIGIYFQEKRIKRKIKRHLPKFCPMTGIPLRWDIVLGYYKKKKKLKTEIEWNFDPMTGKRLNNKYILVPKVKIKGRQYHSTDFPIVPNNKLFRYQFIWGTKEFKVIPESATGNTTAWPMTQKTSPTSPLKVLSRVPPPPPPPPFRKGN